MVFGKTSLAVTLVVWSALLTGHLQASPDEKGSSNVLDLDELNEGLRGRRAASRSAAGADEEGGDEAVNIDDHHRLGRRRKRAATTTTTAAEQDEIIRVHNDFRRKEGASDMYTLRWNDVLARLARAWAKGCVFVHGQPDGGDKSSLSYETIGQNLFLGDKPVNLTASIKDWFDEKPNFDFERNSCPPGQMCGHYTQLVWATSTEVGCGYVVCPELKPMNRIDVIYLVCNYGPGGNMIGTKPYQPGPSCTNCSSGQFYCNNGLCDNACTSPGPTCTCSAACQNCGKVTSDCRCSCNVGSAGNDCSKQCKNFDARCGGNPGWPAKWCSQHAFVADACPALCGKCVTGSSPPCVTPKSPPEDLQTTVQPQPPVPPQPPVSPESYVPPKPNVPPEPNVPNQIPVTPQSNVPPQPNGPNQPPVKPPSYVPPQSNVPPKSTVRPQYDVTPQPTVPPQPPVPPQPNGPNQPPVKPPSYVPPQSNVPPKSTVRPQYDVPPQPNGPNQPPVKPPSYVPPQSNVPPKSTVPPQPPVPNQPPATLRPIPEPLPAVPPQPTYPVEPDLENPSSSSSRRVCVCVQGKDVAVRLAPDVGAEVVQLANSMDCFRYQADVRLSDGRHWYKVNAAIGDFIFDGWIDGQYLTDAWCPTTNGPTCLNPDQRFTHGLATCCLETGSTCRAFSGNCPNSYQPNCPSLSNIRCKCLEELILFSRDSRIATKIVRGTEAGGDWNHTNGYMLSLEKSQAIGYYVYYSFVPAGFRRSDGARQWRSPRGNLWSEGAFVWDVFCP